MTAYTFSKFANPTSDVVPQPVVDLALEFTPTATISANEGVFVWDNFNAFMTGLLALGGALVYVKAEKTASE